MMTSIYSSKAVPHTAAPRSIDPADFPALAAWFQFMEAPIGDTTVLVDTAGNITDMTVTQSGSGDADATYGALTCSKDADVTYAISTYNAALNPGTNSMIIEIDANLSATTESGAFMIDNGYVYSASKGWAVVISVSGALVRTQFIVRNAANSATVSTTLGSAPDLAGVRNHICIVWDRTIADPGSIDYYVGGVKQGTYVLSGTVGTSVDAVGGNCRIGYRDATHEAVGTFYNARVWTPASIPADISSIVLDMATNHNEFPVGMRGVT